MSDIKIKVLFPTIRPKMMKSAWKTMQKRAVDPDSISLNVAVNTQEQKDQLAGFKVRVVGNKIRGVTHAAYQLSKRVRCENPFDIIILMSDDFIVPDKWDKWVRKQLHGWHGCLMVRDGYQEGGCITLPIMTYGCLERLNHVIYHPSYVHLFSDAELYDVLKVLHMVKDRRHKKFPLFEHKHWAAGKRSMDSVDHTITKSGGKDEKNYKHRRKWPVEKKLKVRSK